jgi:hypothetical protein
MKQVTYSVRENSSRKSEIGNLIVSVRSSRAGQCEVVVGYPGMANVSKRLQTGDAILYETIGDGVVEIRATKVDNFESEFLVTQVSPRSGMLAGNINEDLRNTPFTESELTKVQVSIQRIKTELRRESKLSSEQFDLISRKLDEIQSASERLGRKDWMNFAMGTLTSTFVSAAFAPDAAKEIISTINSAFAWFFSEAITFLPGL